MVEVARHCLGDVLCVGASDAALCFSAGVGQLDPAGARVVGIILARAGHSVTRAATLEEARSAVASRKPAVVLLDMKLPDGSGFDLVDHMSETPGLEQVPVVVLSGVQPTFDHRTRSDRVVEWLIKPFAERELLRALRDAMGNGPDPRSLTRRSA